MAGIAILLAAAALAHALARALRLPPVPLLLVAGLVLARVGHVPDEFLGEALNLGVTFLLFVTGIELSPGRTRGQRGVALRVGSIQFVLLGMAGLGAALLLGFDGLSAVFLALALTASSTLVVVRLLRQRRQMFEPSGRLIVGVLLLQDLLVILLIPLVTRGPDGPVAVLRGLLAVGILLAFAAAVRGLAHHLTRLEHDEEALLLVTLASLFGFLGLAAVLDLPLVVGAFLAGVTLAGFPVNAVVRPQLASIGDFFSAVFFTALGALIGTPTPLEIVQALVLAGLVVVLTPPLVTLVAEWAGLSARPAIEAGLLLAQTSELSLVVGFYGMTEGEIPAGVFTIIALVTLITMLVTPLISTDRVAWNLMHLHPTRRKPSRPATAPRGHILLLGSGTTGMPLLETLLGADLEVVAVDDDPDVVARLGEAEVRVIRGDATDPAVLEAAGAGQARIITSTIRRPRDNRRLLERCRGIPVIVRVFEDEDADWVRSLGGTPVLYSEAAAEGFLAWFERSVPSSP
jgi:Kef-type K+ transport system membrane component KefB